jgi:hypothetical protein
MGGDRPKKSITVRCGICFLDFSLRGIGRHVVECERATNNVNKRQKINDDAQNNVGMGLHGNDSIGMDLEDDDSNYGDYNDDPGVDAEEGGDGGGDSSDSDDSEGYDDDDWGDNSNDAEEEKPTYNERARFIPIDEMDRENHCAKYFDQQNEYLQGLYGSVFHNVDSLASFKAEVYAP